MLECYFSPCEHCIENSTEPGKERASFNLKTEPQKILIVGSGLAGLSAGVLLARHGREVTLVEQHAYLGGCLQGFQRRGARFDTGFHYVGASQPGEVFARYLQLLGVYDRLDFIPAHADHSIRLVLSNGRRVDIPGGLAAFCDRMKQLYPEDAAGLDRFRGHIEAVLEATPWLGLRQREADLEGFDRYMTTSVEDVTKGDITNPELMEIIYSFGFDSTLPPDLCPFGFFTFIFYTLLTSCNRVRGGGRAMIDALAEEFESHGGRILKKTEPTQVHIEGKYVRSVELSNGETLPVDLMISTCHPRETVRMVGSEYFSPGFLETLDSLQESLGAFKVYMEVEEPVPSIADDHCMIIDEEFEHGVYVISPTTMDGASEGPHTVEILIWQKFEVVQEWESGKLHRRGEDYEAAKSQLAERLIDRVEREFPGLRSRIKHVYTSSALTAGHYVRAWRGGTMGISQDIHQQGRNHVRPRNRVRNLFLAGQSVGTPGIIGTVIFSTKLCDGILEEADFLADLMEMDFHTQKAVAG